MRAIETMVCEGRSPESLLDEAYSKSKLRDYPARPKAPPGGYLAGWLLDHDPDELFDVMVGSIKSKDAKKLVEWMTAWAEWVDQVEQRAKKDVRRFRSKTARIQMKRRLFQKAILGGER